MSPDQTCRRGLLILLSLLTTVGCDRKPTAFSPPNILLVSLDTTRRDHLSAYGYERPTSPVLEGLASQGVRFDLAYAPTATTGPTHASLFTSLYPPTHGVIKNGLVLDDQFLTLAEALSDHGYQTSAVVSSFVLDSKFGYDQGFSDYSDEFTHETSTVQTDTWEDHVVEAGFDRRADETSRIAAAWLTERRDPERPFFLFVHYFDPHSPYVPPEEFLTGLGEDPESIQGHDRTVLDYDAEIAFTDSEIGVLLASIDRLGLTKSTLVAVTGDHGEGLMQHGHMEHGLHIYEEAVRVPLILRWPGRLASGVAISAPVELVDLGATLLTLAGLAPSLADAQGRNLAAAVSGQAPWEPNHEVFLFRRYYAPRHDDPVPRGIKVGIRSGRWKYILGPDEGTRELFDLEADPGETRNLESEHPTERDRLARRLGDWIQSIRPSRSVDSGEISAEDRERLKALGYLD